jgi:PAS domain S-box-containing protein
MGSGRQGDLSDRDDLRALRERVDQLERLNAQLVDSEERLQILFEQAPDGYYLSDLKGTLVDGNAAAERITGYKKGELIGKSLLKLKLLSAGDVLRAASLLARNVLGQSTGPDEFILTRKDGAAVTVEISTRPVRIGNRRVVLGITRDITERKRSEQALRASEERYHALFDESSDGIALADAMSGTILDCNAALCWMVERDKLELLGQPQSILHPPQQLVGGLSPTFRRHRTGTADESIEDDLISKSGKLVPIEIRAARVEIEGRPCLLGVFRDITERKRVAKEIEALARFPAENPNPVLRVEERGAILYANPASESLLRCRVGGYLPPDWHEGVVRAAKDHARATLDARWEGRDYSILFAPIPGAGYVNVYARDITERRRAEERLRESEENFRTLYENTTIGLYRTTPDGSILLANPTLVKMLGLTSQGALSVRNLEVDGFEPSYRRAQFVERVEREGTVTGLEATWTRPDGISLFVRESARAIRDSDGKTLFYDGTVEDITERKKAEEALRESEDQYRSLVDNVPDIIFTIDLAGKLTFVSQRVKEILGYESAEVINKSVLDFIPEEERQRAMEAIQKGMTGVGIKHFETPMIKRSGERAWFECSFARVRKDGVVIGAQGTAVDITERKRAQEALQRSERTACELVEQLQLVGRVGVAINAGLDAVSNVKPPSG